MILTFILRRVLDRSRVQMVSFSNRCFLGLRQRKNLTVAEVQNFPFSDVSYLCKF
mgnify:CR=1 FL=1